MRKGTPAAENPNQIPEDVKHERFNRLVDIINETSKSKNAAYVGRTEKVLVDCISRSDKDYLEGRTDSFKLVNFKGTPDLIGKILDVRITDSNTFSLMGELI